MVKTYEDIAMGKLQTPNFQPPNCGVREALQMIYIAKTRDVVLHLCRW